MKTRLLKLLTPVLALVFALGLFLAVIPPVPVYADSVDLYWVGDGGSWSDTAHWATAADGTGAPHAVPTSTNNVFFGASSFTIGAQTVTLDVNANCNNLDWSGATNSPTLAFGTNYINFYGNLALTSGMTITRSAGSQFFGAGSGTGRTIATNGLSLTQQLILGNDALGGGWSLSDNYTASSTGNIRLDSGTLNTNNKTVSLSGTFTTGNNANSKTWTFGSSTITCAGFTYAGSNLTVSANTATINISGTGALAGGAVNYNGATFNLTGTAHTLSGAFTCANLTFANASAAQTITLTHSTTYTVTGTFTATGQTTSNRCTVQSSSAGTSATINAATVAVTKSDLKDLIGAGAGSWAMGATDDVRHVSGGSGITYRAYWSSGTGNWSAYSTKWATTSGGSTYLLAATDSVTNVYFDASSFTAGSQTVTVDTDGMICRSMIWTGATNTPALTFPSATKRLYVYGDCTFIAAMSITSVSTSNTGILLKGGITQALTTNGLSIGCVMMLGSEAGTIVSLADNLTSTYWITFGFNGGTLNTNDKTLNIPGGIYAAYGNACTLNLGSSTINITDANPTYGWIAGTNVTITGTSTINCSKNFTGGSYIYNIVNLTGATSTVSGNNSYAQLNFTSAGAQTITLTAGSVQTATTFSATGSSAANRCSIQTSAAGSTATISAGTVTITKANLKDLIGAGAGDWNLDGDDVRHTSGGSGIIYGAYWKSGTGNWSDTTKWQTQTNGSVNLLAAPDSVTNVHFDASSFTAGSQTVTVDATANCLSMDWTGATNTPTLAFSTNILQFYGNVTFIAGMNTTTGAGGIFRASGSASISLTTNGLTIAAHLQQKSDFSGTLTLQDNLTCNIVYWYSGTYNFNGKTINATGIRDDGASAIRTLTLGSATLNVGYVNLSGTNLTLTSPNTATFNDSGNFIGNNLLTYYIVNLTGATPTVTGNNTFNTLGFTRAGIQTITMTGYTQTVTNFTRDAGTSIKTIVNGSLVKAGGGYVSVDYYSISGNTATPAPNQWYAGTHSTNGGGNSGWNFYAPDAPTVTVQAATLIHAEDAQGNGTVTNLGAGNLNTLANGFDWGLATTVYTHSVTGAGSGLAAFLNTLTTLPAHTTIYYRAKAQNSIGWGYSGELTFVTEYIGTPTNFIATINGNNIDLTWALGTYSSNTYIVRGTSAYPTSLTDGTLIYSGVAALFTDVGIYSDATQYYYSAFGNSGVYYSPTYAQATAGGEGMTLLGQSGTLGIFALLALGFMVGGFATKKPLLAMVAAVFWIIGGIYAYTLSTINWDFYFVVAFAFLMLTVVSVFSPAILREKATSVEEYLDTRSDMQKYNDEMMDMNAQLNIMRGGRIPPPNPAFMSEADITRRTKEARRLNGTSD